MEEGILNVKGGILYFDIPGITSIQLQDGATLEIYLGEYWIAGTFHYHKKGNEYPFELQLRCQPHAERPSFCGLLSGMIARVHLEEVLTITLPPQNLVGYQHMEMLQQLPQAATPEREET